MILHESSCFIEVIKRVEEEIKSEACRAFYRFFRNTFKFNCHFPISILGQVWYLIVSIPSLCTITYFNKFNNTGARMLDSINHMTRT